MEGKPGDIPIPIGDASMDKDEGFGCWNIQSL